MSSLIAEQDREYVELERNISEKELQSRFVERMLVYYQRLIRILPQEDQELFIASMPTDSRELEPDYRYNDALLTQISGFTKAGIESLRTHYIDGLFADSMKESSDIVDALNSMENEGRSK